MNRNRPSKTALAFVGIQRLTIGTFGTFSVKRFTHVSWEPNRNIVVTHQCSPFCIATTLLYQWELYQTSYFHCKPVASCDHDNHQTFFRIRKNRWFTFCCQTPRAAIPRWTVSTTRILLKIWKYCQYFSVLCTRNHHIIFVASFVY